MKKQKWRLGVGIVVLIALFAGLTAGLSHVLMPYNSKVDKIEKTLYSDDEDMEQTEIALIGGSHANNGFNPSVMWRDYRMKAYNFSFSGEPVYLTCYYLQELLKKRSFKVVVLDLYYIGQKSTYFSKDSYVFELVANMKWSREKLDFISQCVEPSRRINYWFPMGVYHSRWSELTREDILRQPNLDNDYLLGSDYHLERHGEGGVVSFEPWNSTEEVEDLPERTEEYLRKTIQLVQQSGSQLLLVALPYRYNDANAPDTWVEDEYPVYNRARQIAREYGVNVLQFDDDVLKEIGFIPEEDMYNKGHMNLYGSEKVSNYLGQYICENFEVTRFPEGGTDLWDIYLKKYEEVCSK